MTHVLEAGFEVMEGNNPNGSPKIKGYNIVNGQLTEAQDGRTAWESFLSLAKTMSMLRYTPLERRSLDGQPLLLPHAGRLLVTWEGS